MMPREFSQKGFLPYAKAIKAVASMPVIATGALELGANTSAPSATGRH